MACFSIERQEMSDLKEERTGSCLDPWPIAIIVVGAALCFAWIVALAYGTYRLLE